jgi:putative endonuclease
MAERSNAAVLKTVVPATVPGVRIPLSPLNPLALPGDFFFTFDRGTSIIIILPLPFFAYILKSGKTGTYYYGSTEDLQKRLLEHNKGKVRYTKGRRPWNIHYFEEFGSRSEAYKRELFFKSLDGYHFLKERQII